MKRILIKHQNYNVERADTLFINEDKIEAIKIVDDRLGEHLHYKIYLITTHNQYQLIKSAKDCHWDTYDDAIKFLINNKLINYD